MRGHKLLGGRQGGVGEAHDEALRGLLSSGPAGSPTIDLLAHALGHQVVGLRLPGIQLIGFLILRILHHGAA